MSYPGLTHIALLWSCWVVTGVLGWAEPSGSGPVGVAPRAWASWYPPGGVVLRYSVSPLVPAGRPAIVGIVNVTEDSFSDGGRYLTSENALAHARQLRSAGAGIIELGPAASHPDAARVTADDQRRPLASVIDQLTAAGIPVSVDSFHPDVQPLATPH